MDLIISLAILIGGWSLVYYWENKSIRDRAKKRSYPSATVHRLDDHEKSISD